MGFSICICAHFLAQELVFHREKVRCSKLSTYRAGDFKKIMTTSSSPPLSAQRILYCFPHAGGGTSSYHFWKAALADLVKVVPVQLPGREARLAEKTIVDWRRLLDELILQVSSAGATPFDFFGHSLGALMAFELTRELRQRKAPLPRKLYLSGRRAPTIGRNETPLSALPDDQFIASLASRYGGIPQAILKNAELLQLFLPALRADFILLDEYRYVPSSPLECPVLLLGGSEDTSVHRAELEAWQELMKEPIEVLQFPGTHFYLHDRRDGFLRALRTDLQKQ